MESFIDLTDRLDRKPDVGAMLADLRGLRGDEWINHYDRTLSSDYVALTLVSVDGREDGPEAQRHLPLSEYGRYRPTTLLKKLPYFSKLLDTFECPKGRIRISKLGPGASIAEHRDILQEAAGYAFGQVRLHIPIKTNPHVAFWIDQRHCPMAAGHLYYGDFTKKHRVENRSNEVRIHLVMDLMLTDWLKSLFPPITLADRVSFAVARTVTPMYWKGRRTLIHAFWRNYEGSALQALYRRLK